MDVTTLGDEFVTDLDPGLQEVVVKSGSFNTHHLSDLLTFLYLFTIELEIDSFLMIYWS